MSATSARRQPFAVPPAAPGITARAALQFGRAGRTDAGRSPVVAPIPSRLSRMRWAINFVKREALRSCHVASAIIRIYL